ncbi:MAG: protein translocase subunit SecD [Bacteroidales bacterium]|nr:protein translocase subunit SecD [Bacteroidales bacterium]
MRNKGLILFFTILVAVVCLYCLSFSFVTWKVEKDARSYANDPAAISEVVQKAGNNELLKKHLTDSLISRRERNYLASMKDTSVYLGFTYKECKYRELNLGLDLKGGMNVTLEISTPDVLSSLASIKDSLFNESFAAAIKEYDNGRNGNDFVDIFASNFNKTKASRGLNNATLANYFGDKMDTKNASDDKVIEFIKKNRDEILDQTFLILRTRIDKFGVAQPNLEKVQGGRILVELPGVKEKERVEDLLKSTAQLEFWEVYKDINNGATIGYLFDQAIEAAAKDAETAKDSTAIMSIRSKVKGSDGLVLGFFAEADTGLVGHYLPLIAEKIGVEDVVYYWGVAERNYDNTFPLVPLKKVSEWGPCLSSKTINGARIVRNARQNVDEHNRVIVEMAMESDAAKEWQRITKNAIDNRSTKGNTNIAIVLDQTVYSYPTIQSEIANGRSQISGNFTIDEAKDLATVLNSGNLEVGVNIVASEVVGPTLGKESINKGLISFLIAFILVLIYMLLYYDRAGLVADLALLCNVFFIIGVLASLGAVLTLPGIAGLVLTLGMAVDANVLIYERIREEVRAGKGQRLAVEDGYKNAYSAIIDGNVTTLITGIVLYIFGSGPVQGFATTLIIGILSSMFTAIFVSRMVFDTRMAKGKELSFGNKVTMNAFSNANFDFLRMKKVFYPLSGALIVVMIISFCTLGLNPGIDFTGGRNYVVRFDQDVNATAAREAVTEVFGGNPQVKTFGNDDQIRVTVNYKVDDNSSEAEKECYDKLYKSLKPFFKSDISYPDFTEPDAGAIGIQSYQKVQATIAAELLRDAIWAVLVSLIAIFIYIAIRFKNWQFGLGGVLTLIHDTTLTIGLFSLFYMVSPFSMEIDLSFIAAILTVIGYSINNVVIIYDRVRENFTNSPKGDHYVLFNNAVNSTLGRTVNTCGTTILVLLIIFIFGGEVIRGFVFAMGAGILIGTYSGIYIATPLAYDLLKAKNVKVARQKITK